MITITTNGKGSGDWIVVSFNENRLYEGSRLSAVMLQSILDDLGHSTKFNCVTDEEMEQL